MECGVDHIVIFPVNPGLAMVFLTALDAALKYRLIRAAAPYRRSRDPTCRMIRAVTSIEKNGQISWP